MANRLPLGPVLLLTLGLVPVSLPVQADAACTATNDHNWFMAVVDDSEERLDFRNDVLTFEAILEGLRQTYCIPDSHVAILAFDGSFTLDGTTYTYPEASEEAVKAQLAEFGDDASAHSDSLFFFFLSSHGMIYAKDVTGGDGCSLTRRQGSFSALHSEVGGDGMFHDCELGRALNTEFDDDVRMAVFVDCSFCGGFSDSLTAVSGTIPDQAPHGILSSGVPGPQRIVMTGCAMTTECFGGGPSDGSVFYDHLEIVLENGVDWCDGWTVAGFPTVQGVNAPRHVGPYDEECTVSEWFFAAVGSTIMPPPDAIGIQQQFRIKYGSGLTSDIQAWS